MFATGIGPWFDWSFRRNRRTVERVIAALNARNYSDLEQNLSPEFVYFDAVFNALDGRDAFVTASARLRRAVPDIMVVVDGMDVCGDSLLIRGRMESANPEFCSDSLWQARFGNGLMTEVAASRSNNAIPLPKYAERVTVPG